MKAKMSRKTKLELDCRNFLLTLMLVGQIAFSALAQVSAQESTAPDLLKPCAEIKEKLKYMSVPGYSNCAVIARVNFDNEGKVKSYLIVKHPVNKAGESSGVADLAVQIAIKALPEIKALKELHSAKPVWIYLIFDNRMTPKNQHGKMNYYVSDKLGIYADMKGQSQGKPVEFFPGTGH